MSMVTTWMSDVYHLLRMCYVYTEVRYSSRHQSDVTLTSKLLVFQQYSVSVYADSLFISDLSRHGSVRC